MASDARDRFLRMVVYVAWLSVLLGFVIEALLLLLDASHHANLRSFAAELVQKLSWSTIVCVGLALGGAVSKGRHVIRGLAGLVAAPLGFTLARALHKSMLEALLGSSALAGGGLGLPVVVLKAVEYGCLGVALGWLGERSWGGLAAHVALGLITGLLFGGVLLGLSMQTHPHALVQPVLLAHIVNEVVFPVGCSVVVYSSEVLLRRLNLANA